MLEGSISSTTYNDLPQHIVTLYNFEWNTEIALRIRSIHVVQFILLWYKRGPMNKELLTDDQLRSVVEKKFIEHIKLCQDNFIYFVKKLASAITSVKLISLIFDLSKLFSLESFIV